MSAVARVPIPTVHDRVNLSTRARTLNTRPQVVTTGIQLRVCLHLTRPLTHANVLDAHW